MPSSKNVSRSSRADRRRALRQGDAPAERLYPEVIKVEPMNLSGVRPISVTIAALLIIFYAGFFILWDLITPFERFYTSGPASVILGIRVFGIWAQLMHTLQLIVAVALVYGLWTMQRWGWWLVQFVTAYMLLSNLVWVTVYQEMNRVYFGLFYLVLVNLLLILTYPHRERFV